MDIPFKKTINMIKKCICTIAVLITVLTGSINAQRVAVKISPVRLATMNRGLAVEYAINDRYSIEFEGGVANTKAQFTENDVKYHRQKFSFQIIGKGYFDTYESIRGYYLALRYVFAQGKLDSNGESFYIQSLAPGLGYQAVFGDEQGIVLDCILGFGINKKHGAYNTYSPEIVGRLALGYAF